MCIHPKSTLRNVSNCLDQFDRSTLSSSLFDEISDPCCYIDSVKELAANEQDLIVIHLNIRSIANKQVGLIDLLQETSTDVCLLNETWLTDRKKGQLLFDGYDLESVERSHKKGGGVGILVSKQLNYKRHHSLEMNQKCLESCMVELKPVKGKSNLFAALYRPPNSNIKELMTVFNRFLNK